MEAITDDFTGTSLNRPGLRKIRDLLADNKADGVVVYRSDRLTRNLAHSLILREEFTKLGKEIHFVNHGQYNNSPEGRMIIDIEAVFNQYWRDKSSRTRPMVVAQKPAAVTIPATAPSPMATGMTMPRSILSSDHIAHARRVREYAARGIDNATWEDKRKILEMMDTLVTVFPERIVVQFNMSIPAFEIPSDTNSLGFEIETFATFETPQRPDRSWQP